MSNKINAGLYVFNTSILDRIEPKPTSIEKEIFPFMAKEGQLYAMELKGFWMDVGQPKDYLLGTCLYLNSCAQKIRNGDTSLVLATGDHIVGDVLIHPTAKIGNNCKIGPNVVIGANVTIGDGVRLSKTVIFSNTKINNHCWIDSSIIGWRCNISR